MWTSLGLRLVEHRRDPLTERLESAKPGQTNMRRKKPGLSAFFEKHRPVVMVLLRNETSASERDACEWTSLGLNQGPPDYESVALTN